MYNEHFLKQKTPIYNLTKLSFHTFIVVVKCGRQIISPSEHYIQASFFMRCALLRIVCNYTEQYTINHRWIYSKLLASVLGKYDKEL